MKCNRFTTPCLLMSAAALTLSSCRIINNRPDFHWLGEQFTPPVDDTVMIDSEVGALNTPAAPSALPEPIQPLPPPPAPAPEQPGFFAGIVSQMSGQHTAPVTPPPAPQAPPAPVASTSYTVVAGDTLSKIAAKHNTGAKTLLEFNRLDKNKPLQIGQKLQIPVSATAAAPQLPRPLPAQPRRPGFFKRLFDKNTYLSQMQLSPNGRFTTYTVVAGDTLSRIAAAHGTSARSLVRLNRLDVNRPLRVGQKLQVPAGASAPVQPVRPSAPRPQPATRPAPAANAPQAPVSAVLPTPAAAPAAASYTIQPGDTLFGIARKLNVAPDALMQVNGITPETADALKAGDILKLPTSTQP